MRNLLVVTQGLSTINNTIFFDVLSKFDKDIKGGWGWLLDGIETNAKSDNFVFALMVDYEKIKNGQAFIKDGWSKEALMLKETLAFFDFRDRYNNLELESALLTLKYFEQDKPLVVSANNFSAHNPSISVSVYSLVLVDDNFFKQTEYLRQDQDPDMLDSINDTETTSWTILTTPAFSLPKLTL